MTKAMKKNSKKEKKEKKKKEKYKESKTKLKRKTREPEDAGASEAKTIDDKTDNAVTTDNDSTISRENQQQQQQHNKYSLDKDSSQHDDINLNDNCEQTDNEKFQENDDDDDNNYYNENDDDVDDILLQAAAAAWVESATSNVEDSRTPKNTKKQWKEKCTDNKQPLSLQALQKQQAYLLAASTSRKKLKQQQEVDNNSNYSLHITQLPYDCTEMNIREVFAKIGCSSSITDIRLVYDTVTTKNDNTTDRKGTTKKFRGVAFVDMIDETSFQLSINELHGKHKVGDRIINVRPVKTKEELAQIVETTKEKVKQQIKKEIENKKSSKSKNDDEEKISKSDKKKDKKEKTKSTENATTTPPSSKTNVTDKKKDKKDKVKPVKSKETKPLLSNPNVPTVNIDTKPGKRKRTTKGDSDENHDPTSEPKKIKVDESLKAKSNTIKKLNKNINPTDVAPSVLRKIDKAKKRRQNRKSQSSHTDEGNKIVDSKGESNTNNTISEKSSVQKSPSKDKSNKSKESSKGKTNSTISSDNKKKSPTKTALSKKERNRKAAILRSKSK